MTVQSRKKLQIPDKNTFKIDRKLIKMPKRIFCFINPHGMSRALESKFLFQYMEFPTRIFSLEKLCSTNASRSNPTPY